MQCSQPCLFGQRSRQHPQLRTLGDQNTALPVCIFGGFRAYYYMYTAVISETTVSR